MATVPAPDTVAELATAMPVVVVVTPLQAMAKAMAAMPHTQHHHLKAVVTGHNMVHTDPVLKVIR